MAPQLNRKDLPGILSYNFGEMVKRRSHIVTAKADRNRERGSFEKNCPRFNCSIQALRRASFGTIREIARFLILPGNEQANHAIRMTPGASESSLGSVHE
jgi:hypothetical protein